MHHIFAQYKRVNVTFNIQMLQHSEVCSNVEYLFIHHSTRLLQH